MAKNTARVVRFGLSVPQDKVIRTLSVIAIPPFTAIQEIVFGLNAANTLAGIKENDASLIDPIDLKFQ